MTKLRQLGHNFVGTEHLLLGLIREGEGIAAGVLESLGVNLERARSSVMSLLGASNTEPSAQEAEDDVPGRATLAGVSWRPETAPRYTYLKIRRVDGLPVVDPAGKSEPTHAGINPGMALLDALDVLAKEGWQLVAIDRGAEDGASLYVLRR